MHFKDLQFQQQNSLDIRHFSWFPHFIYSRIFFFFFSSDPLEIQWLSRKCIIGRNLISFPNGERVYGLELKFSYALTRNDKSNSYFSASLPLPSFFPVCFSSFLPANKPFRISIKFSSDISWNFLKWVDWKTTTTFTVIVNQKCNVYLIHDNYFRSHVFGLGAESILIFFIKNKMNSDPKYFT